MKKIIAVALVFTIVFAFAACKNRTVDADGESTEPTGTPGDFVTDENGDVQTTATPYLVLDDNSEPRTQIGTDEEGNSVIVPVTTMVYEIQTYPAPAGETLAITTTPTVPAGNTVKSNNEAWPSFEFMSSVPKAVDTVDRIDHSDTEAGEVAAIWINEMSYANFLSYISACESAGFEPYTAQIPDSPVDGQTTYIYGSVANGIYLHVTFNTDDSPSRFCDVLITVSDYDVNNTIGEVGTGD